MNAIGPAAATLPVSAPLAASLPPDAAPVAFRGGGFAPAPRRGAALVAFALLLGLWELAVRQGWVDSLFLPPPSAVAGTLWGLAADGTLWRHLAASLRRILGGWAMGTAAGLCAGGLMGIWSLPRAVGVPVVSAFFPIPKIALLPLFILWLGIGEPSKFAVIALGVFFPTTIATFSALDGVPRGLVRMAQSFSLSRTAIIRDVMLPGALPGILAGFRITSSIALILLVAAEMIGAEQGIGAFVLQAGQLMQTDQLLAGVVVLSLLGLTVGTLLSRLERRFTAWR